MAIKTERESYIGSENFQKRKKNLLQSCAKYYSIVTIEIGINSTCVMGIRVTICCQYCISFEEMLLFLVSLCCLFVQVLMCRLFT